MQTGSTFLEIFHGVFYRAVARRRRSLRARILRCGMEILEGESCLALESGVVPPHSLRAPRLHDSDQPVALLPVVILGVRSKSGDWPRLSCTRAPQTRELHGRLNPAT